MNWLNKLERRFGRFAVPNLTMYLIGAYIIGYGIYYLVPNLLLWITLEPGLILRGQVWRLVSWVLIPPSGNIITIIIMLLFYYSLGTALERSWGAFRYNVYIFSGIIFTVIGAFLLYFVAGGFQGIYFSTYYINMSIFLAFAASYPDMEILLYFVLPIKIKWMGLVYAAMILYYLVMGNMGTRVAIVASLFNFILFFFSSRNMKPYTPKERARKAQFKRQSRPHMTYPGGARHRCAVCGRTELDNPALEFRFCSKCKGNYEYCQDHLFTHQHVE
ncbi:rhomboid family intramembrane serine protease [Luxibacter massiliensis]|uniref:rhomboid family intramembrane serine protease n=1 Tax=Luxibacter massiliensis TaxID=2219695 RepID=UPI000F04CD62|nr:rhomboid family intramembrane serine protease [Luxibacter massiliensis]